MPNKLLFVLTAMMALLLTQPVVVQASEKRPAPVAAKDPLRERIVGAWRLEAIYEEDAGGEDIDVFGADPQGQLIATESGYFSFQIVSREGRRLGANRQVVRVTETRTPAHERQLREALAYFGTYVVDPRREVLTLHIAYCLLRGCDDTNRTASIAFQGDKLVLTSASDPSPTGSFYSRLVWRRE